MTGDCPPPAAHGRPPITASAVPRRDDANDGFSSSFFRRPACWIAERTSTQLEHDGSAVVRHRVADPRWIVRHVLQYAGDAVVEEPAQAREWIASAAMRVANA